jgi:branched-chain amino acid transport system substrate-binding protein
MAFPIHSRHTRRSALQLVGATGLTMVGLPATVSRAALDAIHVAVVVDTSGAGGVYGAPVLKGMLLAATEINAREGVNGHALDLTVSDGRSDLARVSALVRHACHDTTTVALVGPTLSSEAVKVDPLAQAAGLPVLAVSNTVPGLTAIGPYIFRIALGDAQIIPVVLKTAQARLHFQKVALLYDKVNAATVAARTARSPSSSAVRPYTTATASSPVRSWPSRTSHCSRSSTARGRNSWVRRRMI